MKKHFNAISIAILFALISFFFNFPSINANINKTKKNNHKLSPRKNSLIQNSLSKLKTYLAGYENISFDFINNYPTHISISSFNIFSNNILKEKLLSNIISWLGTPYKMAGSNKKGIDCSNFVAQIIKQTLHISFPANAQTQSRLFTPIFEIENLTFGDLIFFTGRNKKSNKIGHVGIYLGNGIFAHSSTGKGVVITHISEGYYSERFRFGGRISEKVLNLVTK